MDDMRFNILSHLNENGHSTEEYLCNDYLSSLKTYKGNDDIGTVFRAIHELCYEEKFLKEERSSTKITPFLEEKRRTKDQKTCKRFNKDHENYVGDIYLSVTLKGRLFMMEHQKFKNDAWFSGVRKATYFFTFLLSIAGSGFGFYNFFSEDKQSAPIHDQLSKESLEQPKQIENNISSNSSYVEDSTPSPE